MTKLAGMATWLLLLGAAQAGAATITVNSVGDTVSDSGQCVLREAISAADGDAPSGSSPGECAAGSGSDTVVFDFGASPGPHLIVPTASLPPVTTPVVFDASAESHEVVLDGILASVPVPEGAGG